MPREPSSKYVWPASAITSADMALLHAVRKSSLPRVPINVLISRAVRAQYGSAVLTIQQSEPAAMRQAA